MRKFFSKNSYNGAVLDPFCKNLGKNKFSWKNVSASLNIPIIYDCAENQKKLMTHCWEKCQTDRWTDRQTDSDFIEPSVGQWLITDNKERN